MKLAAGCLRFGIKQEDCRSMLIYDYVNAATGFKIKEADVIIGSIYRNYQSVFGCAAFEKNSIIQKDIDDSVFDASIPPQDVIYLDDIRGEMWDDFRNGTMRGETTYFPSIDER